MAVAGSEYFGAVGIAEEIKTRIVAGKVRPGGYLSSIRALSREFGCAPLTAQRALRQLADIGLVVAEPRHGYRVVHAGVGLNGGAKGREVVAFLEATEGYEGILGDIYELQLSVLRRGILMRGWVSAILPYAGQSADDINRQLREMGATSLILQDVGERFPANLSKELAKLKLPTVSLDETGGVASGVDQVMRDESQGGRLAAEYLLRRGHRRIGWYGPLRSTHNARRRFAGAAEAMIREGVGVDGMAWQETEPATEVQTARDYLMRPDRPIAVLALWQTAAQALVLAARELEIKLGRDLDLVGWSLDEQFRRGYASGYPELAESSATVLWSMADVGRQVLSRIEERRRDPELPAARILLPMKLREPDGSVNGRDK